MGKEERDLVWRWYHWHYIPQLSENKLKFIKKVERALQVVDKDYYIATIEPSIDRRGKLYYKPGNPVALNLTLKEWKEIVEEFSISRASRIATMDEVYLWYAYRIAMKYWSLDYVCNMRLADFGEVEVAGKKKSGGFADGVENTTKIVSGASNKYYRLGYSVLGEISPAYCEEIITGRYPVGRASAIVVMEK